MHLNLEGKVVLVTGGTKGIGRAIVEAFLEERATVHFCSRTAGDIDSVERQFAKDYTLAKARGAVVDVAAKEQLVGWVESVAKERGGIDVVVGNVSALGSDDDEGSWEKAFRTDMMGTWHLIATALPYLEKTKGNVVTIASASGRDVDFTAPGPYGSFKLAHTYAPKGIRANTVSPGNTYFNDGIWAMIESEYPDLFKSQFAKNPMGRMGTPEEVANAVVFLASDKASFISGANLNVDGALNTGVQF